MKYLKLMICALTLMICVGCTNDATQNINTVSADNKIEIGLSFDSFVIERWQRDRDVFVSVAKELGAEVNVQNANGDVEEQKRQIEYFIKKGVDAILIISIDSLELNDVVQKAKNEGIKVIAYDRMIENGGADLYISFDNEMVGTMMGEALVKKGMPNNSVIMIEGATQDHNVVLVEKGFKSVMEKNGINIIDSYHADGWRAELAAQYAFDHIEEIKKVDAIMCGNDNLATQVISVLSQNRLANDKLVVGQDADLIACQHIVEGTQLMTVYKPVEKLARRAAICTMKLINGEKLDDSDVTSINDGTYDIPYVALAPVSVDKNNINEVIVSSGFHLKEDVYLNIPNKMPK